jgi:hypothetical protein
MSQSLPLVGPTYTNRTLPVSSQVTRNFYVEVNPGTTEPLTLQPFPGLLAFATGVGASRGTGVLNGVLYEVMAGNLYSIDVYGTVTLIGAIQGTGRCKLETDGTYLIIATGEGKPYSYDGTTLTQGSDVDLPNASTVTYINRRVVYDGSNADIAFADLDEPLTVNSANVIIAEAKPDNMKAVYAYKQQVYAFGEKSIQPMFNSGTGNPPYAFILNATQEVGIAAVHSIASNNNAGYFLGSDQMFYQLSGLSLNPIGNPAIGHEISSYSDVSDCYGLCFTIDNQNFYLASFTTGNESWLFNEAAGMWTNLAYGDGDQHLIASYDYVYGKHLVSDRRNGNIYELDFDTYTDNGDTIHRQRDTVSINGKMFGRAGAKIFMDKLELTIDPGQSLVTAESQIIMQYSDDNGKSWSSERWAPIGNQGEYFFKVCWYQLGWFYNRMFRFKMTDPIKWVLISLDADMVFEDG